MQDPVWYYNLGTVELCSISLLRDLFHKNFKFSLVEANPQHIVAVGCSVGLQLDDFDVLFSMVLQWTHTTKDNSWPTHLARLSHLQ